MKGKVNINNRKCIVVTEAVASKVSEIWAGDGRTHTQADKQNSIDKLYKWCLDKHVTSSRGHMNCDITREVL